MEDLALWLLEHVAKFPRAHKFTVGDRIVTHSIEASSLLCEAAFSRDKVPLLRNASRSLFRLQTSVRLALRLKMLNDRQYAHFALLESDVGRQLSGWLRSSQRKATEVSV
jgi:hypothetical protein